MVEISPKSRQPANRHGSAIRFVRNVQAEADLPTRVGNACFCRADLTPGDEMRSTELLIGSPSEGPNRFAIHSSVRMDVECHRTGFMRGENLGRRAIGQLQRSHVDSAVGADHHMFGLGPSGERRGIRFFASVMRREQDVSVDRSALQ